MRRPLVSLQDLRRRIYAKAKSEGSWRFWGLYVHVCKRETLHEAYRLAKAKVSVRPDAYRRREELRASTG